MKNVLVQYQGGGYSGCFWEWNFFFLDAEGKFHDIFSSGDKGITTQEEADILLDGVCYPGDSGIYLYDVTQESAWQEFSKECHPGLVVGVVDWFNKQEFVTPEAAAYCQKCGCSTSEPEYCPDRGVDEILCEDCYCGGLCEDCENWSDDIVWYDTGDEDGKYLCPDCRDYRDEENLAEQRHDLLWASLITGTPDLFSEEMRWLFDSRL